MRSYIVLMILISSVIVDSTEGYCDTTKCGSKLVITEDDAAVCASYNAYLACLQLVLNGCTPSERSALQAVIDSAKVTMKALENCVIESHESKPNGVDWLVSPIIIYLAMSGVTYFLTWFQ